LLNGAYSTRVKHQILANNIDICQNFDKRLILNKPIDIALRERFKSQETISKANLIDMLKLFYGEAKPTTLAWRLHELTQENVLARVGFGLYRLNDRPICPSEPSLTLRQISDRLKTERPLITCCVWDTRLLASLMIHQPMKHLQLVEVDRDASMAVYHLLRNWPEITDQNKQALYLYEDWLVLSRRGFIADNPVIIKPLVSEAPLVHHDGYTTAPLEKILVDLLADQELYHAYQEEVETMFRDALERFIVNRDKLRRYARRRNRFGQVQALLDDTTDSTPTHSPS